MNTLHQDFQKAKEELIDLLKHHEAVLAFQESVVGLGLPEVLALGAAT